MYLLRIFLKLVMVATFIFKQLILSLFVYVLGDQIDEKERLVLPCAAMALKNKLFCCLGVVEHDQLKVDFLVPCIAF